MDDSKYIAGLPEPESASVFIVLHHYSTGPGQELHDWLKGRCAKESVLLEHPFPFSPRNYARMESVERGSESQELTLPRRAWPLFLRYGLDFLRTIRLGLKHSGQYDLYVGNGAFDTLAGLVLRRFGKVRRVVLYTIDYAPNVNGSWLYAALYRIVDRFCCYHVDCIWNLSTRMMPARLQDGHRSERCVRYIHVPHGTHARKLAKSLRKDSDPNKMAFMGHIKEGSGLHLVLEAMAGSRDELPMLRLEVIGDGPLHQKIEQLVHDLDLTRRVTFRGYIEKHEEVERLLSDCGIGLALYDPETSGFSVLADPGKPKVYMACGLPVIISDVPEVADIIDARGAGISVAYDRDAFIKALRQVISFHDQYRVRALRLAAEFDWDVVFSDAWKVSS